MQIQVAKIYDADPPTRQQIEAYMDRTGWTKKRDGSGWHINPLYPYAEIHDDHIEMAILLQLEGAIGESVYDIYRDMISDDQPDLREVASTSNGKTKLTAMVIPRTHCKVGDLIVSTSGAMYSVKSVHSKTMWVLGAGDTQRRPLSINENTEMVLRWEQI